MLLDNLPYQKVSLGFDSILDDLDRIARNTNDNFPRHNIIKLDDYSYLVEIAVAGFSTDDIDITVKDGRLIVKGQKQEGNYDRNYLHKGISSKNFSKELRLPEHMKVGEANLVDGILSIECFIELPEEKKPKKISIGKKKRTLLTEET